MKLIIAIALLSLSSISYAGSSCKLRVLEHNYLYAQSQGYKKITDIGPGECINLAHKKALEAKALRAKYIYKSDALVLKGSIRTRIAKKN